MTINWSGKRRWIALALLIASILVMIYQKPVIPVIQLPGEVWPGRQILGLPLTNTLVGSVVVWILIGLLLVYIHRNRPKSGAEVPRGGFYNFFEMAYEFLYNFVEGIAGGPHMRFIFSFFMTIFFVVLLSNWLEMIPGVDSVGFLEAHVKTETVKDAQTGAETTVTTMEDGHDVYQGFAGFYALNPACPWVSPEEAAALTAEEVAARKANSCTSGVGAPVEEHSEGAAAVATTTETTTGVSTEAQGGGTTPEAATEAEPHYAPGDPNVPWVVLPYVRVPSTDLNLTLALALISVVATQYLGVRALGPGYFLKFFNVRTLLSSAMGGMDLAISLLEMIGEFAKILSFSFRLLGNIFAGSILLFVISFLVPAVIPWALFLFEFFVGIIQAMIFGLLTAIFMSGATVSHHAEEQAEGAH